jgi:hypothetical protein
MRVAPYWKTAAAGGLAATALLLSVLALAALSGAPAPPFNSRALGFADPHERRANALLRHDRSARSLGAAAKEAQAALALSPYNNAARLRLAYIEAASQEGRLGPAGLVHLTQSYDLVPFDHTVAAWRIGFALEHWEQLTPEVRGAVQAEAHAFSRSGSKDVNVQAVLRTIRNPAGRLAAALWLRELSR